MAAYKSLQQERAEARYQKHLAFATDTAWQMVGFAEQAIKYREDADGAKVPKALYRSDYCILWHLIKQATAWQLLRGTNVAACPWFCCSTSE